MAKQCKIVSRFPVPGHFVPFFANPPGSQLQLSALPARLTERAAGLPWALLAALTVTRRIRGEVFFFKKNLFLKRDFDHFSDAACNTSL